MNKITQSRNSKMKMTLKNTLLVSAILSACFSSTLAFADAEDKAKIKALESQLKALSASIDAKEQEAIEKNEELENQLGELADVVDAKETSVVAKSKTYFGGYGELHYSNLDNNGEDERELDFHRMVLLIGHDFNEKARFISEFEVEHVIASGGSRGAVEVEQAYVELDLKPNLHFKTGLMLMPIGIINETHEPTTFYGVERPIIETTIIPSTWFSTGLALTHELDNGLSYDLMVHEGLKTEDPNSNPAAEPFNIKKGKQKGSFASGFDLGLTARVKYTGKPGLELAGFLQYQPDLDQSAKINYADSATLMGGHVIYQMGKFTAKGLYARWDLAGDLAANAGKDVQDGGYIELDYKHNEKWGVFVRQSAWSQETDEESSQTDLGVNFYPNKNIVFKADYQLQNEDAGNIDGFRLGFGYQF
ncbi:MAG: outer membrane murein-binding lipoprotein Lpp [Cocleimonas sp.]|jgi:outer membrane murein-binding lipoprotein Lpp